MSTASPRPANVAAAAALQFSIDFNPSHGDSQPSVVLLTQNIGGIETAYGGLSSPLGASSGVPAASNAATGSLVFPSTSTAMAGPSIVLMAEDVDPGFGVSATVRQQVADFIADLRTWLHRVSYMSDAARRAERAARATAGGGGSTNSAGTATFPTATSSSRGPAVGPTAESLMRGYTPAARPPMVDVLVIHFQEMGGKYKNRQFNRYFKEQLSAVLLPEAGWTSGLLVDERERDGAVVGGSASSRARTAAATTAAATTAGLQNASPTSGVGLLYAPACGCTDSHSGRSSNDASCTEMDGGEGEADPYFTAIGSIIFLSPRITGITSCLSVPHRTYIPIADDPVTYAGDAGRLFLSGKFSEAGRSRKGFLMASLRIGTVQFNVCNLHLLHDDDNRVAFAQSPSKYTDYRIRAVQEAMAECSAVIDFEEPLFLFGDFNVRMDGKAFVQWAEANEHVTIRPGRKKLRCPEHLWTFFSDPARAAEFRRAFDGELQRLMDEVAMQTKTELGEMPVTFAPTYSRMPYRQRGDTASEAASGVGEVHGSPLIAGAPDKRAQIEEERPREADERNQSQTPSMVAVAEPLSRVVASPTRDNFSHDRLPAWCDRVLFNVAGLEWISGDRVRPSRQPSSPSSATTLRDRRKTEASHPHWYVYEAIDFVHMDHDGVYLMF
ncbi:putative inositol-1 4 5-trisphosphate (IP3) 5-phosphatase [Leptomonas seymouri]|uniref:Putative inositol-1 4 5-trisphosphate (IP3) 5-phosphatase n=1 Tax=Leptomonas seymouri TaxID=5684 RepID=A0A0N0P2E4_LEPSE|nr:putative inositol-1 4 5-trisphosphate (IP3) 5-phosphatase [Leptomonas seymouri]|eukprot:KPI82856.1 putative inositol-1 4 5-trisphosphate (IP3) 5-phosphatase [Leptomonas seymouri]